MQNNLLHNLTKLVFFLLLSFNAHSSNDESNSIRQDSLDIVLMQEYSPCSIQDEIQDSEVSNLTSIIILSGDAVFIKGDELIGSSNAKAIVDSYDLASNKLTYYQTVSTGFKSFSLEEKVIGKSSNVSTIKEFVIDFILPCSDLIASIEENPEQMIFIFSNSDEALEAQLAAQEMMAEIEAEMARQAALEAFQQKLADERAASADRKSTRLNSSH